ncbi:protein GLUTELIN PRECURSOR ACCUMULATION 3-like isoform X2 [Diospyros lotus]|uniref:protein GLUTELIN PRECURSOR ACCUMULATION 3-like isoform X2 n=1 Tax=Diospyros lotus TaxID=55363 RepID=UPI0022521C73|nr:protein GLUTELIN PRECURSOR ACCUMULATION 3-like isoform X2 [Diospyros lotus]
MKWEKLSIQSRVGEEDQDLGPICGPGTRWGHTCNAIRDGKLLYVFGGYGKDNSQTNQVHVFDTATRTWSEPVIKGTPPVPRDSHSCSTVGDNLFVFGGTDGRNPLKDLHILDTSTNTWMSPNVRGEGPAAREGHSATLVGKRLFIFGGCGKSSNDVDEEYYGDLYILNTETFVWQRAITSGTLPTKRDNHTCSSWKNKIIVIGGEDAYDYYLSDVHILDADTLVWTKLSTSGQLLPPRAGHSTIALGKNLFVFGGFTDESNLYDDIYMLDVDTGVWTKVIATGEGPSARFSMSGDSLHPIRGGVLVFFGGCNKDLEALDDMYFLHTGLTRENERDERRFEKLSLRKQLKLKCQEQNMLASPVSDKALVRTETKNDFGQPIPVGSTESSQPNLREYLPFPGKRTFHAKVTKCFPVGYTIETVIDGKVLRGVLFSNKSINSNDDSSKRIKGAAEINGVKMNVDQKSFLETPKPVGQDKPSDRQADSVRGENVEAASTPNMKGPACSVASQPDEVPGNLNLPVAVDNVENLNLPNIADGNMEDKKTMNELNTSNEVHEVNTSSAAKD